MSGPAASGAAAGVGAGAGASADPATVKPVLGLTLVGDVDAATCEGDTCGF